MGAEWGWKLSNSSLSSSATTFFQLENSCYEPPNNWQLIKSLDRISHPCWLSAHKHVNTMNSQFLAVYLCFPACISWSKINYIYHECASISFWNFFQETFIILVKKKKKITKNSNSFCSLGNGHLSPRCISYVNSWLSWVITQSSTEGTFKTQRCRMCVQLSLHKAKVTVMCKTLFADSPPPKPFCRN